MKTGAGGLALNNANTYSAATISGGTLTVANGGSLAAASISLTAGSNLNVGIGGNVAPPRSTTAEPCK